MKRKSFIAVIISVVCVVMAMAMMIPMGAFAAEATPVTGFTWADAYYQSEWVGSSVIKASYGSWVKTDGPYNGAWQWSSELDKVIYDSANGTLTFKETSNPSLKYFPGQINVNPLGEGASYCSVDLYYTKEKYTKEDVEYNKFSGVQFQAGAEGQVLFCVDDTGKCYVGNSPMFNASHPSCDQLDEGWNTIEFILLPMDKDGNVLESANGKKPSDSDWPVTQVNAYVRFSSEKNPVAETRAYTWSDLNATGEEGDTVWNKVENYNCKKKFFGTSSGWGAEAYLKPYKAKQGEFTIANAKAVKLGVGQEIYRYTYAGYPTMSQAVPAASSNREITVASAKKTDAPTEDVKSWINRDDPSNLIFLKPGDTVTLSSSMEFTVATGADEAQGELKAALDRVRINDLPSYTYPELQTEIDNIEAAASKAGLPATHEYMVLKGTTVEKIEERMLVVEEASLAMIDLAVVFDDENLSLAERRQAYKDSDEYRADLDPTYSEDAAAAYAALQGFENSWVIVEANYDAYLALMLQVELADPGPDKNAIYQQIITNFNAVAAAYDTFEMDPSVEEGYIANMDAMKERYEEQTSIVGKYDFLASWVADWASFNQAMYFGNAEEVPAPLADAVAAYNAEVKALNQEIIDAAITAMTIPYDVIESDVAVALLSDIKSKVNVLYDDAQSSEEW